MVLGFALYFTPNSLHRNRIMTEIWGEHMNGTQSLRVFVAQLRKKIEYM
jgi:DNA-binding response OmpR family regulator